MAVHANYSNKKWEHKRVSNVRLYHVCVHLCPLFPWITSAVYYIMLVIGSCCCTKFRWMWTQVVLGLSLPYSQQNALHLCWSIATFKVTCISSAWDFAFPKIWLPKLPDHSYAETSITLPATAISVATNTSTPSVVPLITLHTSVMGNHLSPAEVLGLSWTPL